MKNSTKKLIDISRHGWSWTMVHGSWFSSQNNEYRIRQQHARTMSPTSAVLMNHWKFSVEEATDGDCSNKYGTCHRRQSFIHSCEAEKTFIKKGNGHWLTVERVPLTITGKPLRLSHSRPLWKDGNIFRGLYQETIGRFDTLIHNVPLSNKYILNTLNVPDFIAQHTEGMF